WTVAVGRDAALRAVDRGQRRRPELVQDRCALVAARALRGAALAGPAPAAGRLEARRRRAALPARHAAGHLVRAAARPAARGLRRRAGPVRAGTLRSGAAARAPRPGPRAVAGEPRRAGEARHVVVPLARHRARRADDARRPGAPDAGELLSGARRA